MCIGWLHQRWSSQYHGMVKKNQEHTIRDVYVSRANDKATYTDKYTGTLYFYSVVLLTINCTLPIASRRGTEFGMTTAQSS